MTLRGTHEVRKPWYARGHFWIPVAVLAVAVGMAMIFNATGPEAERRAEPRPARLVRVLEVQPQQLQLEVVTHGTVAPRTESDLIPEVSGPVTWVSPALVSGGFFERDEPLLRVDRQDYEVALEQARANLVRRRSEHARSQKELERRRGLARRDAASARELDNAVNDERVAGAQLREARAQLEKAERDLERTEIRAPFEGRVREENVDVGQFVNRGSPIAKLYAIDYAEVRLPIRDDELGFVDLPLWERADANGHPGPEVLLSARFAGADHTWRGQVVRTEGEIDPRSRMVHVVARVEDPYGRAAEIAAAPLAVGLFVSARIQGNTLDQVAVVPRYAMRGADELLVVDSEDRLRFRKVEVVRRDHERVVIGAGLAPGERVCLSPIETPVDGMPVRPVLEDAS